jgi:hypothetical protein
MLIHMTIAFAGDRIYLKVAHPYIHRVEANLIAVDRIAYKPKRGPMVLAIGERARSFAGDASALVMPAYDPDAFEPGLAGAVIAYYRTVLFQPDPSPAHRDVHGRIPGPVSDRLLPRYEQLPTSAKDRFVLSLGMAWHRSKIFANHRQLPKPRS